MYDSTVNHGSEEFFTITTDNVQVVLAVSWVIWADIHLTHVEQQHLVVVLWRMVPFMKWHTNESPTQYKAKGQGPGPRTEELLS